MTMELESPKQMSERTGWTEKRIRKLVNTEQIRHLRVEGRILLPKDAVEEFVRANIVAPKPKMTK